MPAVTLDANTFLSLPGVGAGSGTNSIFYHICSGSDRLLIVSVVTITGGATDPSYVYYNNVAMTFANTVNNTSSGTYIRTYYMMNPPTGNNTIIVRWAAATRGGIVAASFNNVSSQYTPPFSIASNGSPTLTIPSINGFEVYDVIASGSGDSTTLTVGDNQTQLSNFVGSAGAGGNAARIGSSIEDGNTASNSVMSWTISGGSGPIHTAISIISTDPSISVVDGDNIIFSGQQNVVANGFNLSGQSSIQIASSGKSINVATTSSNANSITFNVPFAENLFSSNIRFGSVTLNVASFSFPLTLNPNSSYFIHTASDVSQNANSGCIYYNISPSVNVGDQFYLPTNTSLLNNLSIDSQGFPVINSSADITDFFSYRIYDVTDSTWGTEGNVVVLGSVGPPAVSRSFRVAKSVDGKRYSKFPSGDYVNNSLTWSAANLSDNTTLTITTDGTYNFGSIGPTLLYYDDYSGAANNTVASITPKLGRGSVSNNSAGAPLVYDVSEMPYGKGLVIGAEGTNQNDTNYRQFRVVDSQTSTEFFEWFYHYYPTTNQNNAQPYLFPNSTWQVKGIWHFYGSDGYSSNTKSDIFGATQLLYTATGNYTSGYKWGSNDRPISTFDTSSSGLRGATSSSYLRSNPLLRQHWVKASPLGTQPNGSDGMYRIVDSVDGEIQSKDYYDIGYFDSENATQSGYDRFNLPGFVRGYLKTYNAHMYYGQIYQAVGAGAAARVEIGNSSEYKTATKLSICTVQSWSSTQIQIKIRTGIFYNEGVANLWFYIHNSNNDLVATGRLV